MSFEEQPHCSLSEEAKFLRGDSEIRNCIEHNALDKGVEGNTASLNEIWGLEKRRKRSVNFPNDLAWKEDSSSGSTKFCHLPSHARYFLEKRTSPRAGVFDTM